MCQIHAYDPLTRPDEVAAALLKLKREGKIRWIRGRNLNVEQMRMYSRRFEISCLKPPYNLLSRDVEKNEFPYCLAERMGAGIIRSR